jgi:pSer/pThr/pTyr-binding forkhead associated (FHA) protein
VAVNPRIRLVPDDVFIEIDWGSLYLGRDCHLAPRVPALLSKVVSNRHCCIKQAPDESWALEDLGSTNGTWLRGERLTRPAILRAGDVFSLGRVGPKFVWEPGPDTAGAEQTLLEDPRLTAPRVLGRSDGSEERPFRVGKTPEIELRHQQTGQRYEAKGYTIVLGRDPEVAQIVIRSPVERHVSGRHAEIQFRSDGRVMVRDLQSANGTWLNDREVKDETQLAVGDRLMLGAPATALVVTRLDS